MGAGRKCCKFGGPGVRARLGTWLSQHCAAGAGARLSAPRPPQEGGWTVSAASRQWEPRAAERVGGRAHPLSSLQGAKDVGWGRWVRQGR